MSPRHTPCPSRLLRRLRLYTLGRGCGCGRVELRAGLDQRPQQRWRERQRQRLARCSRLEEIVRFEPLDRRVDPLYADEDLAVQLQCHPCRHLQVNHERTPG